MCVHRCSRAHKWSQAPRALVEQPTLVSRLMPKAGSVGVNQFGSRVTRQTAGLAFVGMRSRLECLGHSAPRLSFLLVRLGGFAADYFRGNPSTLRAARLSGARCSDFGKADARLITIGELDAGRLECTL